MKKKIDKGVDKNHLQSHNSLTPITEIEKHVLYLYMEEHLSQSEIARRRKTSRQNISRICKNLRKKGLLESAIYNRLQKGGGVTTIKKFVSKAMWRFHALHFVITPFYFEPRYHKWRLKKGNIFYSGDWRFVLHEDIIEVQLKELVDFCSVSKWESLEKAGRSFTKQLTIEANRYGFHVFKEGKANIRICNQHLECTGSDVGKAGHKGNHVKIRGPHDGKIYFVFDKSKGPKSSEYIHSDLAVSDSEKFEPYFNSIRYKDNYLPHEVKEKVDILMSNFIKTIDVFDNRMEWMADNNQSHQKVLEDMGKGVLALTSAVEKLTKRIDKFDKK